MYKGEQGKADNPHRVSIAGREIEVYSTKTPDSPVIYLNTFEKEGAAVHQALRESGCAGFTLAVVSGLSWQHDMSPWSIPPFTEKEIPCTGGADAYLQILTKQILPAVEQRVPGTVSWRGLAGYSLAGLFALYALYQTESFTRTASISGSLWYPAFQDYVFSHKMTAAPEAVYFSLGDKESRTRNPRMKTVRACTEEIEAFYRGKSIATVYELNPGNHFQDVVQRTAAGIAWLLGVCS